MYGVPRTPGPKAPVLKQQRGSLRATFLYFLIGKEKMEENLEKNDIQIHDVMKPIASLVSRQSMNRIIENSIVSIEKEHLATFLSIHKRPMNEHEKTYLRKIVLKRCKEYLSDAIETLEYYQKT